MEKIYLKRPLRFTITMVLACVAFLYATTGMAQVTVSSFSPTQGAEGTIVTITGTNFNTTAANNTVYFGSATGLVLTASATSLTVQAPSGASLSAITVVNTGTGLAGRSKLVYMPTFTGSSAAPTFTKTSITLPSGAQVLLSVQFVDLDGDGRNDMVVLDGNGNEGHIYIYQNTTVTVGNAPTFSLANTITFINNGSLSFGDMNNDGKPDIVCFAGINVVGVFINASTGIGNFNFASVVNLPLAAYSGIYGPIATSSTIADFDGDGKQDIVTADFSNARIYIYKNNNPSGTFSAANFTIDTLVKGAAVAAVNSITLADLDGDGRPELIAAVDNVDGGTSVYSGGYVAVYPNNSTSGSPSVNTAGVIHIGAPQLSSPANAVVADFDKDGKMDIAWADGFYANPATYLYVSRNTSNGTVGNFSFATASEFSCGSGVEPYFISTADLNGDGLPDIIVPSVAATTVNIFTNTSTGIGNINFSKTTTTLSDDQNQVYAADLNGDSKPDYASIDLDDVTFSIFQNTSAGSAQVDYYSKSSGNLDAVGSWGTYITGAGFAAPNFTNQTQIFHPANSSTGTISGSNWTVSGTGAKVVLDRSTDLTISSTKPVNATIDVAAGRKLTISNTTSPTLGTLSSTSTVDYLNLSSLAALSTSSAYGNVLLDGTTLSTLGSTVSITDTLKLQNSAAINNVSGAITVNTLINGGTISLASAGAINISGSGSTFGNTGNISGAGTVAMNGTAAQAISGAGTVSNLKINNAAGVTITLGNNMVSLTGALTMTAGTLTTNSNLTLISNASGTARIATIAGGNVSGNVTAQQYIQGNRAFRFLGHPFSTSIPLSQVEATVDVTGTGGSANGFTNTQTDNPSAFWYNTLTGDGSTSDDVTGWIPFTSTNGTSTNAWNHYEGLRLLVRGSQGQGLNGNTYTPSPATISMSGPVNQGSVIESTLVGAGSGYNMLGNPYPSPTDIGTVINSAVGLIGPNYWVWDVNQGLHGAYVSQTVGGGAFYIPANTSFVVNAGTAGLLTFAESNKGATATESLLKTRQDADGITLHIYDTTMHSWDRVSISLNANASNAFEQTNDAKKLHNANLDFYTISSDNQKLCTDARPYVAGQVIQLGIATDVPQKYIIKAEDFNLPAGADVYLHDKYLNQYQQLQDGSQYTFSITSDPASQGDNRFELGMTGNTTGIANVNGANGLKVSMVPNPATEQVTISYEAPKSEHTTVRIMSMTGQSVATMELGNEQSGSVIVPLQGVAAGMYLVELTSGTQTVTQRLVKQ